MATRVYFPREVLPVIPAVTPGSWSAGWNKTTGVGTDRPSLIFPLNSLDATQVTETNAASGTSGHFTAIFRNISAPLMAQTISGNIKGQFLGFEPSATDNFTLAVAIKVIDSSGSDRGALLAVSASDDTSASPPEFNTSGRNNRIRDSSENTSLALSSLAVSTGDRIVYELGYRQASTSVAAGGVQRFAAPGSSDFAESDIGIIDRSWIEFDTNIIFAPEYFGSASTPADGAAATNTADPTAVTPPTGMLAGDLVFLIGDARVASLTLAISQAGGQTWTTHAAQSATTKSVRVFTCTFNGTWSANPSVSFGSTTCNSAYMHVFRPPSTGYTWSVNVAQTSTNDTTSPFSALAGHTTTGTNPTVTLQGWHSPDDNTWGTLTGTNWEVTGTAQYRNTSGSDQSASFAHIISTTAKTVATPSKLQATLGPDNTQMWAITMAAVAPAAPHKIYRYQQAVNRAASF